MDRWRRRGELAKELGITVPTVKYYTHFGLFPVDKRTPHGQFLYDLESIRRRFLRIRELKEKRLTMQEIKDRLQIEHLIAD